MPRRWSALAATALVVAAPILSSCGDDDDAPSDPTVTLFEPEPNPNVSTDVTT